VSYAGFSVVTFKHKKAKKARVDVALTAYFFALFLALWRAECVCGEGGAPCWTPDRLPTCR